MITPRLSSARGHFNHGWLDTYHTFSFSRYHDPEFMGFRSLRVINEDTVAPGRGFPPHPHENMEIITVILTGELAHKDSGGHSRVIRPGDVQHMSAGTGIVHSEFNPSPDQPVNLLQIWIEPNEQEIQPRYDQKHFAPATRRNTLRLVASPDGHDNSIRIHADAKLYVTDLLKGQSADLELLPTRHAWVQVIRGGIDLNGQRLSAGDGAAVSNEDSLKLTATDDAEALIFDLA